MSVNLNQSAIAEVRDQLSLDYADGTYLNVISQNLGLERPIIGFDDDTWRALVKQLAIEYKQIETQFYKMMEIIFGVQVTQAGSLASAVTIGDKSCVLNDTSQFPQVGTLIFDEGLSTQETHKYCFIDRSTNTVYLDDATFKFAHVARLSDAESPVLTSSGTSIVVADASQFPGTDDLDAVFPYPVVLGRGTATEEVVSVTACNRTTGVLTLDSAPTAVPATVVPTEIFDDTARAVYIPSSFVALDDTSKFPASGVIRLTPTNTFTITTDVVPLTNTTITVAADTFVPNSLIGFELVMATDADADPGTSVLGRRRRIIANDATSITIDEDWSAVGNAPADNDTFLVFPIVDYVSNNKDDNVLNLRENLDLNTSVSTWLIDNNSVVELMETKATVAFSPVKSLGVGWDIIQSTPGKVELLIPTEVQSTNDTRSASYLHTSSDLTEPTTRLSAAATTGDTLLSVNPEFSFPRTGTLQFGLGETQAYSRPIARTASSVIIPLLPAEVTSLILDDTSKFGSSGTIVIDPGTTNEEQVTFSANNLSTNTLTVSPLTLYHPPDTLVVCHTVFETARAIVGSYASNTLINLYDTPHTSTDVVIGDYVLQPDTWRGPYVYDEVSASPTGATTSPTTLDAIVPGPSLVTMTQQAASTAIEVTNALPYLGIGSFTAEVGVGKGTSEKSTVTQVSLRSRTNTTVNGATSIGATTIPVNGFGGATLAGAEFPDANGYRIIVDTGANTEVFVVTGQSGGSFTVASPAVLAHADTVPVRLMSDVLKVDAPLTKNHDGAIAFAERSTATESSTNRAIYPLKDETQSEIVSPIVNDISPLVATGLDVSGGRVILNFGNAQINTESTFVSNTPTSITVADGTVFPSVYPYILTLSPGKPVEESVVVTGKTSANVLDIDFALGFTHAAGDLVVFEPGQPETLEYDEITSNDLRFDDGIMLNYTHYPSEPLVDSSADSDPRENGFDFPFRLPDAVLTRLQYLIDIIRAAGIQVEIIEQR